MNTYEVLIIFKPILDVENVDAVLENFQKNIVEANQGQVAEVDRIGRKRLAFEIGKFKDGFMTLYLLKFPPEKVADFRRACQINEDVLRVTLVRQDSLPQTRETFQEARREEGPGGRPHRGGPRRDFGGPRRDFGGRGDRPDFRGGDRPDRGPDRGPRQSAEPAVTPAE